MAIKKTLTKNQFVDDFRKIRGGFSMEALESLFDYFEELSEDMGQDIEFDPIAICGDWDEIKNEEEAKTNFGMTIEELEEETQVLYLKDYDENVIGYLINVSSL